MPMEESKKLLDKTDQSKNTEAANFTMNTIDSSEDDEYFTSKSDTDKRCYDSVISHKDQDLVKKILKCRTKLPIESVIAMKICIK